MNTAWNMWVLSYGVLALTLVTVSLVILHLDEKEEEMRQACQNEASPQRGPDKYDYK